MKLRFPRFTVEPHSDREVCTFFRIPMDDAFDMAQSLVVNVGVKKTIFSHHFLAWVYEGTDLNAFPADGEIVDSKACLDFGATDTSKRTLIAGAQTRRLNTTLESGLAQRIMPTTGSDGKKLVGVILNTHWINSGDRRRKVAAKLKLTAAKPHTVRRLVLPIFDVFANISLKVAPGRDRQVDGVWGPGLDVLPLSFGGGSVPQGPACIVSITSHMHKRGKLFTVDLIDTATDQVVEPDLLRTTDYSDPPQVEFHPAKPIAVGQGLRYTCTHDNGVEKDAKFGCEEQAGVVPGISAAQAFVESHGDRTTGAAKFCTTDADCAGFRTGRCVPANLVFGYTGDDDMCILPGGYYEANADGGCDISGLPIIN